MAGHGPVLNQTIQLHGAENRDSGVPAGLAPHDAFAEPFQRQAQVGFFNYFKPLGQFRAFLGRERSKPLQPRPLAAGQGALRDFEPGHRRIAIIGVDPLNYLRFQMP